MERLQLPDPNLPTSLVELLKANLAPGLERENSNLSDDESDSEGPEEIEDVENSEGQQATIKELFEGPPKCDCCINWVEEVPDDLPLSIEEQSESKRHALLVRMKKSHDQEGKPLKMDSIVIQSPHLKNILGEVFKDYTGITTALKRLVFRSPFHPFFYEWQTLGNAVHRETDPVSQKHGRLLRKTLRKELSDVMLASKDLSRNGVVTFDFLWTIFKPGIDICSSEDGFDRMFRLIDSNYCGSRSGKYFQLQVRYIDFDGKKFGYASDHLVIWEFSGTKSITSLDAYPYSSQSSNHDLRNILHQRGLKFRDLQVQGHSYKAYRGLIKLPKGQRNVDGRIIIDSEAYANFNPEATIRLDPLEDASLKSSIDVSDNKHRETDRFRCDYGMSMPPDVVYEPTTSKNLAHNALTDDLLYLCSHKVRGYCLKTKDWATFSVDGIEDLKWNEGAFESLVLPDDYKRLITAFVESQMNNKSSFDDIIEGKGQGVIMLLQGSPGVGKTLTAEALADRLRKPLYVLSAAELGDSVETVEYQLEMVLEVAAKWDAVLLLDESDVFLEKRSADNLERNAIVAIFLRLLEYYRGVLFMTTNRVHAMDPAFESRIHLIMDYPELEQTARHHIWTSFVERCCQHNALSASDFEELSRIKANGREIKNFVKTAQLLARHENALLSMEHFQTIMRVKRTVVESTSAAAADHNMV